MSDIEIIKGQPKFRMLGENLGNFRLIRRYKGKFLVTKKQMFIRLIPLEEWNKALFFHDQIIRELGVFNPTSIEVHQLVLGGGIIEVSYIDPHFEIRLSGKSTIYGACPKSYLDQQGFIGFVADYFQVNPDLVLVDSSQLLLA